MPSPTRLPAVGEVLAGKYRLERDVGDGSLGPVMEARHLSLATHVAIKFLHPKYLEHGILTQRFLREARAAASIRSEHVGRVLDMSGPGDEVPYMVMELLGGSDLSQLLQERGPLPISVACDYLAQACDAIAEAHALGIVHRDLKVQNLYLTVRADGSPVIKVVDFGVSKWTPRAGDTAIQPSVTMTGTILGSVSSMSPEQIKDAKRIDHRTDIWALGATLHELLTGSAPFSGESEAALCRAILLAAPKPLSRFRSDAPRELESVILTCLQRDPANRFQSVSELVDALQPYLTRSRTSTWSSTVPVEAPDRGGISARLVRHWEARAVRTNPWSYGAAGREGTVRAAARASLASQLRWPIAMTIGVLALGAIGVQMRQKGSVAPEARGAGGPLDSSVPADSVTPTPTSSDHPVAAGSASLGAATSAVTESSPIVAETAASAPTQPPASASSSTARAGRIQSPGVATGASGRLRGFAPTGTVASGRAPTDSPPAPTRPPTHDAVLGTPD